MRKLTGYTEALEEMKNGNIVVNCLFRDDEYIYMNNSIIYDENGYNMGNSFAEFLAINMKGLCNIWYVIIAR